MMMEENTLFNLDEYESGWLAEWHNIPEFIQENQRPLQQITVSFATYEDVKEFANLIGMNVTPKTKSTWFPHRPHRKYTKGYKSEK
jgi:hypothetical protein